MLIYYFSAVALWFLVYLFFQRIYSNKSITLYLCSMSHWILCNSLKIVLSQQTSQQCLDKDCYNNQIKENFMAIWFIPASYFTFDMIIKLYLKKLTSWYFIHHSLSILLNFISFFTLSNIMENSLILYYSTFCNIPMNYRDILRVKKQQDTIQYHLATVIFIACYFYGFVIGMTYLQKSFNSETNVFLQILLIILRMQAIFTIVFRLRTVLLDSLQVVSSKITYLLNQKMFKLITI